MPEIDTGGKKNESVRREILYNILIDYGVPVKLVRPIKMCLNETYSTVRTGKHLSETKKPYKQFSIRVEDA
jgi:hypothetical protein